MPEKKRQFMHLLQHIRNIRVFPAQILIIIRDDLIYIRIGHSVVRVDKRLGKPVVNYLTLFINSHKARQCKPVYTLIKRTDPV